MIDFALLSKSMPSSAGREGRARSGAGEDGHDVEVLSAEYLIPEQWRPPPRAEGDTAWVDWVAALQGGEYICTRFPGDHFPVHFELRLSW
jgi:hypothetical protein